MKHVCVFLLALMATPGAAWAGDDVLAAAKAKAEAFERPPVHSRDAFMTAVGIHDIALSPDGQWLSFHREAGDTDTLFVRHIDSGKEHRVMANSKNVDARWSGDGALLWLVRDDTLGIHKVKAQAGRIVFRFDKRRRQRFMTIDARAADHAVVAEKVAVDGEWRFRYLSIDSDGKITSTFEAHKALLDVLLDEQGRIRYATGYDGENFDTVTWRVDGQQREERMRCPLPERCTPVAFHTDGEREILWSLAHNGENLKSLQRWSSDDRQWRVLHSDPRGISGARSVIFNTQGTDWLAVAYRPGMVTWHGNDTPAGKSMSQHLDYIAEALPDTNLDFTIARDGGRWLVKAARGNWQNDRFFLFNPDRNELTELFADERRGAIPPAQLADVSPVHWHGKDGMALHGYAYLPKGVPLESAPVIAMIHGGPYNHSTGEYDIGAQLLANRGYIVFKPNFRASTGYGVAYVKATEGNFGKHGVLDDILTGMDYLLENGIGDADKQAVVGHSFGGYASLLAVTHYPDRFAFAVPTAAPVNMAWTMEDIAIEGGSALSMEGPPIEILFPGYGVPYGDAAWHQRMYRDSPLAHAEKLSTPVYLWAGAKDDRVAVESLVRYVAEANTKFKPTLLIDPDAGHSPRKRLNTEALAWLIEAAADKHFGGGVTPPSPELARFLEKNLHAGKTKPEM